MNVAAILPAAGHGTRMGKSISEQHGSDRKQFMKLGGVPILILTIRKFLSIPSVKQILVAIPESSRESMSEVYESLESSQRLQFITGGRNRQESVKHCLDAVDKNIDIIVVHDAVRPFVTVAMIEVAIEQAAEKQAVILGLPADETVKQVSRNVVRATLQRERIMLAQTPQVFSAKLLRRAFEKAEQDDFTGTDEASLVEHLNEDVYVMNGSERNIKITRPNDMTLAKLYYEEEQRGLHSNHRL